MKRLLLVLASFGLVAGLGSAVMLHGLPASLVGDAGFTAYIPPDCARSFPVNINLNWFPSLLWLAAVGVILGVIVALVLGRLGWRLTRSDVS